MTHVHALQEGVGIGSGAAVGISGVEDTIVEHLSATTSTRHTTTSPPLSPASTHEGDLPPPLLALPPGPCPLFLPLPPSPLLPPVHSDLLDLSRHRKVPGSSATAPRHFRSPLASRSFHTNFPLASCSSYRPPSDTASQTAPKPSPPCRLSTAMMRRYAE